MTVCLVRCPSPFLIDERAFPPLGLMAVGAGLKQAGHDVVVHDGEIEQLPMDYDYYGFGPTSPEYPSAVDAMCRIRQEHPGARVVIGGPHATLVPEQCEYDGFDCTVTGDGELAAATAFFTKTRRIDAEPLPLDTYPIADRSLVDIRGYSFKLNGRATTTVMGSRGCSWKCSFCCKNNPKVRLNSAERLIDEIGMLHDEYGYRAIAFPEDIFTLNKKRTVQVCEFLKRKGIVWRCLVRADLTVKYGLDFLDMMIDSGCIGVGIGIESGSNTILRNVNKAENIEQMHEAIAMLKSRHVFIKGFFIVGLPGETEETLAETERFLQRARLDDIDCKIFQPYPGSPIYDNKAAYDIDWDAMPLEYTFYKGRPGEYYGNVRTSALSSERLLEAWKHFEDTYKDWTNAIESVMVNEEDDDGLCV